MYDNAPVFDRYNGRIVETLPSNMDYCSMHAVTKLESIIPRGREWKKTKISRQET